MKDAFEAPNGEHDEPPTTNMSGLGDASGVNDSGAPITAASTTEPALDTILQSTESADIDAHVSTDQPEHQNGDAPSPDQQLAQETLTMLNQPGNDLAVSAATENLVFNGEQPAAETTTTHAPNGLVLSNGTSPLINEPDDNVPTSRNASVLISPTDISAPAPLLNGTTPSHDPAATSTPASASASTQRRHSSRQSKPVDRFTITPIKAAASTSPTVVTAPKTSLRNGKGKSGSPDARKSGTPASASASAAVSVKKRAASASAKSAKTSPAARDASVSSSAKEKERTKSLSVKPVGGKAVGKKEKGAQGNVVEKEETGVHEETEEEASLRLAMEMQAQEFGLRRRSK